MVEPSVLKSMICGSIAILLFAANDSSDLAKLIAWWHGESDDYFPYVNFKFMFVAKMRV